MNTIEEIEIYAKNKYVPIARKQTIEFILSTIEKNNYKSFFEIGTAIGYTTTIVASKFKDIDILTIEHDVERAKLAKENFENFNVSKNITFIVGEATEFDIHKTYDLIFIDAAKKKNQFFLEKFSKNLSKNGTIIVDNMNLDDLWKNAKEAKKIQYDKLNKEFKEYVLSSPLYDATLHEEIGDGIMVIKLK